MSRAEHAVDRSSGKVFLLRERPPNPNIKYVVLRSSATDIRGSNFGEDIHRALAEKNMPGLSEADALKAAQDVILEFQKDGTLASDWEAEVGNDHLTLFRSCGSVKGTWPLSELCPEFFLVRDVMEE